MLNLDLYQSHQVPTEEGEYFNAQKRQVLSRLEKQALQSKQFNVKLAHKKPSTIHGTILKSTKLTVQLKLNNVPN